MRGTLCRLLPACVLALAVAGSASASGFLRSLPAVSAVAEGYADADSTARRLMALPLCPVEGIWQMTDGGATFVIERAEPSTDIAPANLRMVMLRSPWRSIRPGTVLGHLQPTAKPGVYEARLYSSLAQRTGLSLPRSFLLKIDERREVLTFAPFKSPIKFNLFRMLPYMFRRAVTLQQSRPDDLRGAVRVVPAADGHPLSPVYL